MFDNREDAAMQLAVRLKDRELRHPLVLAIPRGGVVLGAILARELDADLDVVLARKLRTPGQPELALGAVAETGEAYLNWDVAESRMRSYIDQEVQTQCREISRRRRLFRGSRHPEPMAGRSVVVVDDGIATGSTMIAALRAVRGQKPYQVIVAVPVASPDRLEQIKPLCDEIVCLCEEPALMSVGQFYEDFTQVEDEEVVQLLDAAHRTAGAAH
jgi:predicted phosphoribosyltransferase